MARKADDTSQFGDFLADVTRSTVYGIGHLVKNSASGFLNEAYQSTQPAAPSPPSTSVAVGFGAHWLRYLLGRTEWTLPCVGIKVVL
ncbi:hypothetical protein A1O1_01735 [Capronia coronata CBS 617.96]|uniref:Uncharacterized protein n=1 Tax=Capronia coronata CBS 617.96 TaxID=1182541 RepID=W9YLD6_9EURO|nr:uncharacterized protein A1O1_01735 [Capronia coronata CBS 617.96]EXJ93343.1 hypothetical protein A1O1_01735 [Capronia coronata CBS 617.96]